MFLCQQRKLFPKSYLLNKFIRLENEKWKMKNVCAKIQLFHFYVSLIYSWKRMLRRNERTTSNTFKAPPPATNAISFATFEILAMSYANAINRIIPEYAYRNLFNILLLLDWALHSLLPNNIVLAPLFLPVHCRRTKDEKKNLHVIRRTQYYITHNLSKWSFIDTSVLEDHLSFPVQLFSSALVAFFLSFFRFFSSLRLDKICAAL